jgi:hypothetical protein
MVSVIFIAAAAAAQAHWVPLNGQQAKQAQGQVAPARQAQSANSVITPATPAFVATAAQPAPEVATQEAHRAEMLTNESIISLVRAGLGPEAIEAKIGASRGSFDTSTNALIALKNAGVPDGVIAAMLKRSSSPVAANAIADNGNPDPLVPHAPGIYVLDARGNARMIRIDPTVSNQTKTSNILGYAFTYGLSSAKLKTVIPNATARVQAIGSRPTFYFYFNQSSVLASLADFSTGFSASASSPNEFSLVHLQKKGDHREAVIGSLGFASAKSGISDKARVAFTYDDVAPGVFKVTPSADLQPGEYGFVYSVSTGVGSASVARIFDFSVL